MSSLSVEIRADIQRSLARRSSGSIQIHFDGGIVTVHTDEMRWWRSTSPDDIHALADRLALAAEDPTLLLGTTNTGDWHKDSLERRRRRKVEIAISEELRFPADGPQSPTASSPSENMAVDVLMPVKHGAYIRGDVVSGLLAQDRPLHWFVDADPEIEISREHMDLFAPAIPSLFWRRHARRLLRILAKRNRRRRKATLHSCIWRTRTSSFRRAS